jgi:hypothetical protein
MEDPADFGQGTIERGAADLSQDIPLKQHRTNNIPPPAGEQNEDSFPSGGDVEPRRRDSVADWKGVLQTGQFVRLCYVALVVPALHMPDHTCILHVACCLRDGR